MLVAGVALIYGLQSPAANTRSVPATTAAAPPPPVGPVPAAFTELWRAPSPNTPVPLAAGAGVVVADGSTVSGRDAVTGRERWSYTRDRPLCTAGIADGRVLALYRNDEYCSELSTLGPDTGERGPNRTLDARPGVRLIGQDPVLATGPDYVETFRSDLVRTAEYGTVRALEEPGDQPRSGCAFRSFAASGDRAGVLERCPGEASERLSVIRPSGTEGDRPAFDSSAETGTDGAQLIAVSADRAALLLPGVPRLALYDRSGRGVGEFPVAAGARINVPADGVARMGADDRTRYWWTGGATVALDTATLQPRWTVPGTLGAGTRYGDRLLVPVPSGLADVDPATGAVARTVPVERDGWTGPVQVVAQGGLLVEMRGTDAVALGPAR
ncbi:Rv3212 family protein [Pseudonocardia sp. HH130630-07]|uniref:Rv3212 family protein n=1 Tax=Pseudonocardia sp. HH130630-07 TaxID=1690815 RepID=UPI000815222E|nr:PQQ-binding-like beta-propeller repeat protein [Pseudonocardia sp. HH130630-07]ANY05939.1 hypothetical protein AFB00_06065 [Pseudonocardia sp. HH130630-07]